MFGKPESKRAVGNVCSVIQQEGETQFYTNIYFDFLEGWTESEVWWKISIMNPWFPFNIEKLLITCMTTPSRTVLLLAANYKLNVKAEQGLRTVNNTFEHHYTPSWVYLSALVYSCAGNFNSCRYNYKYHSPFLVQLLCQILQTKGQQFCFIF